MTHGAMSSPGPSVKSEAGGFGLRAAPGRIVRFRRGVVIGVLVLGSGALFLVTILALQAPVLRMRQEVEQLYHADPAAHPDGLAALPGDYSQVRPGTPRLGPPLPGDLGRPIVQRRKELGIVSETQAQSLEAQRLAEQALQARESAVFFRIEKRPSAGGRIEAAEGAGVMPAELQGSTSADRLALDVEGDPNAQQRKLDFLEQGDRRGIYNPHALQEAVSPYQVMAGSVISASLITGINSDLPGLVVAQVTENVYDTVTGGVLLIPQGARLLGAYDSVVAFGQSRALLVWQRIVLPDGSSIEVDNLPATDAAGYAGLSDEVDYHTWRLVKGIALATVLGVGTEVSLGGGESDLVRAVREAAQTNVNRAGQRITEKNLNIQPTLTIRPGWPLKVIVQRDLVLRPYQGEGRGR